MSHRAVRAIQEQFKALLPAAKIKESKGFFRYHIMMPQKGVGGEQSVTSMQNMIYDVTMMSFDKIKFGKSVFMIIVQPQFCIVPEMLDHEWLGLYSTS